MHSVDMAFAMPHVREDKFVNVPCPTVVKWIRLLYPKRSDFRVPKFADHSVGGWQFPVGWLVT